MDKKQQSKAEMGKKEAPVDKTTLATSGMPMQPKQSKNADKAKKK